MSIIRFCFFATLFLTAIGCNQEQVADHASGFYIQQDSISGSLSVFRTGDTDPLVVQNAKEGMRPYLHPIMAPDGNGSLTEYSPGHHKHQTGLYWGFTRINGSGAPMDTVNKWFYRPDKPEQVKAQIGRDYFHNNGDSHWSRLSADILMAQGEEVKWKTVYHMLDSSGKPILEETQIWSLQEHEQALLISLEWQGKALQEITVNEFSYGGMFLRMPWREGIEGAAVNAARQKDAKAEGQRAMWVDVGMEIEGREDWGHIAIFDHPQNAGFPTPWRVDGQLGVGPTRAIAGDWKIESGHTEIIKHQLVAYTGDLDDVAMRKRWDQYIGSNSLYTTAALWTIAQEEGKQAEFLTPERAVDAMTVTDGYKVNAWAAEPMITQPMAFCWDDRGRMWIAENRDYENRGEGFSNDGTSRILILEDTDQDGVADKRQVFLEGIPFPSAIAVGFDGLYLGAPPNLLFVPDKNHDDQADLEDIEVLLTGWGIRDRHETINSLHWGPDGWLYGLEGFATPSRIRKPAGKGKIYGHKDPFPDVFVEDGVDINGGVWRFHPQKKIFEVVAHGFSNPWGIDYDAKGQLFITACVIPHMFHVIPGGIYHRQGGQHFNPYVYQDIRTIVDHSHRSAHGGARIYQSDAFPPEQQGRLFMANIHEHAVLSDILVPKGSGFEARHAEDFVLANNAQWIGFSMEIGPSGDLYVLDWHDADICGNSVLQKETGRIFRISPEQSLAKPWPGRYGNLKNLSDEELANLQTSRSDWHARRARVILQARATDPGIDQSAVQRLRDIFRSNSNSDYRLRAMWSLHVTNQLGTTQLIDILSEKDPYVRGWAVQFLCEDKNPSRSTIDELVEMAKVESSPIVRLYLAAALQRIPEVKRWSLVEGLINHAEDQHDHNIPKMIWYGLEPLVPSDPDLALKLAVDSKIPMIAEFVVRRLVDADQLESVIASLNQGAANKVPMLEGLLASLEGRSDLVMPDNWKKAYQNLSNSEETQALALAIAQQFGDSEAAAVYLAVLKDNSTPAGEQNNAIKGLAEKQWDDLLPMLPELWDRPMVRIEAIRALAAYDNYDLGEELLEAYGDFDSEEKVEVVQTMASRSSYGRLLTDKIASGEIPKSDIPAYAARQLRRVVGNGFVEVWGPIDELSIDKTGEFIRLKALITEANPTLANLTEGKRLFDKACGACHQMYGDGGVLGPDLTGSNRDNLDYLLNNILDPNGDIQDDYLMVIVTTRDGRTWVGNIVSETDRQLVLSVVGQDQVAINNSNIQSRETVKKSLMPEGLLQTMTDKEIIDLIAYLQSTNPMVSNK